MAGGTIERDMGMPEPDRRIRVMLADDYPGMHAAVARLLTPSCDIVGSVLQAAHLQDEAVRLHPDVIVLDIGLAAASGLDGWKRLRAAVPATKIVLFSATADSGTAERARALGASDFVSKHRLADDLLPAIRRAMGAGSPSIDT